MTAVTPTTGLNLVPFVSVDDMMGLGGGGAPPAPPPRAPPPAAASARTLRDRFATTASPSETSMRAARGRP